MDIRKLAGKQVDEYTLVDMLGEGGMSAVYKAYQEELDRHVAMKLLSDRLLDDGSYIERFNQEAKTAAALEHQHIVPVYDFGVYEKSSYVVMRLLSQTLEERLLSAPPFALDDALEMLREVAKALDYAHSRGVIHRDIKLSNIMFDETGTAYIVDFGIAKIVQQDSNLTTENIVLGTPSYMSPEQWRDDLLTPAVDQYALAVVMFKVMAGRLPYEADNSSALMYKHLNADIPDARTLNSSLPAKTAQVLARGMAKDASVRYPTVGAFATALRDSLSSEMADVTQRNMPVAAATQEMPSIAETVETPQVAEPPQTPQISEPTVQSPPPQADYQADYVQQRPPRTPQQYQPDPSQQTVWMQIAKGGIIGVGALLALVTIAVIVVLVLFAPEPATTPTSDFPEVIDNGDPQAAPTNANPAPTNEIAITNRAPLNTPQVIGVAASDIQQIDTLIGINPVPVRDVAYSPDGSMFAAVDGEGLVKFWRNGASGGATELIGHSDVASAVAFSPNRTILASAGRDNMIVLWDVATGAQIRRLSSHSDAVRDIDFNTDGSLLASASEDGTVRIWSMTDFSVQQIIQADATRVLTVEFSPLGGVVATGGANSRVRLWQVETGALLRDLIGHSEEVRDIAFSRDGSLIATGSTDNNIILWRFDNGERLRTMSDHARDVFVVTFSPDDSLIASGGRDNNMRVFDTASGTQLNVLTGNQGWVLGVSFSPDGTNILTGGGDGSVRLYGVR